VGVGVGGDRQIALPDPLADPRPGDAAQVQQRDSPVAEVVRAEQRDRGGPARLRDRGPQRVGPGVGEQAGVGVAVFAWAEAGFERFGECSSAGRSLRRLFFARFAARAACTGSLTSAPVPATSE
jgi:hypothetical protein